LQANADLLRFRPSGFNLLGPQYGLNKTVSQDAKAHGLRAFYTVGADVDFPKEKGLPKPIDELAADVAAKSAKLPLIARLHGGTSPRKSFVPGAAMKCST